MFDVRGRPVLALAEIAEISVGDRKGEGQNKLPRKICRGHAGGCRDETVLFPTIYIPKTAHPRTKQRPRLQRASSAFLRVHSNSGIRAIWEGYLQREGHQPLRLVVECRHVSIVSAATLPMQKGCVQGRAGKAHTGNCKKFERSRCQGLRRLRSMVLF